MPAAYEGTDIISYLRSEYIIRHCRISYRICDISLLEIALKESNETSYWLKLLYKTGRIDASTYRYTEKMCGSIRRLLIASCKTVKENTK